MFFVYILRNQKNNLYIGSTENVLKRLIRHNNGGSVWTRKRGPWKLIYHEKFTTRAEAEKREKQIKSYKGGRALKKLIKSIQLSVFSWDGGVDNRIPPRRDGRKAYPRLGGVPALNCTL